MFIKKLKIIDGLFMANDSFDRKSTLLFSEKNSVGKTTYLRILLHALGYNIPDSYDMNFHNLETVIEIENNNKCFSLFRKGDVLELTKDEHSYIYTLPEQLNLILKEITSINNVNLLNSILGLIYIDQEKGWTLLNRGIVIGKNRFDIAELISGLAGKDINSALAELKSIKNKIKQYNAFLDMNDVQKNIMLEHGEFVTDDTLSKFIDDLKFAEFKKTKILKKLKSIDKAINDNSNYINTIEQMKLRVSSGGKEISVNRHTILNFEENSTFLQYQKYSYMSNIEEIEKYIRKIKKQLEEYKEKHNMLLSDDVEQFILPNISKINVDIDTVNAILTNLKEKERKLTEKIKNNVKNNTVIIQKIYDLVSRYTKILGINDKIKENSDFIFTDKLKGYSGTVLHKLVMSFKLAFNKVFGEITGINLPLIIDSPSGREILFDTAKEILNLFRNELPDSQFIISSIKEYDAAKTIIFKNVAIELRDC